MLDMEDSKSTSYEIILSSLEAHAEALFVEQYSSVCLPPPMSIILYDSGHD